MRPFILLLLGSVFATLLAACPLTVGDEYVFAQGEARPAEAIALPPEHDAGHADVQGAEPGDVVDPDDVDGDDVDHEDGVGGAASQGRRCRKNADCASGECDDGRCD